MNTSNMDNQDLSLTPEAVTPPSERQVWGAWMSVAFGMTVISAFSLVSVVTVVTIFLLDVVPNPGTGLAQLLDEFASKMGLAVAVSTIASAIVAVPLIALFVKIRGNITFSEYVGLRRFRGKTLLLWMAIIFGVIVLSEGLSFLIQGSPDDSITVRMYSTSVWPPLFWIAIVVFAPVWEETLFRGFLFEGFRRSRVGAAGTIVLMAFAWSLLHIGTYGLFGLTVIFAYGLILGVARLKTNSLWVPLSMHVFVNLVAIVEIIVLASMGVVTLQTPDLGEKGAVTLQAPEHGESVVLRADLTGMSSAQAEKTMDAYIIFFRSGFGELGVTEFDVRRSGNDQITVRMPEDTTKAVSRVLGSAFRPTYLEFGEPAGADEGALWENLSGRWNPAFGTVKGQMFELSSKYFLGYTSVTKRAGRVALNFEWDSTGKQLAEQITDRLEGKPLAIFEGAQPLVNQQGEPITLSARDVTGGKGVINGLSLDEAKRLSDQINASRLARGIRIIKIEEY